MRALRSLPLLAGLLGLALITDGAVARAEPPGLVIPVPLVVSPRPLNLVADPQDESDGALGQGARRAPALASAHVEAEPATTPGYRWQVVASDALAIGSVVLGGKTASDGWYTLGMGSYLFGAPLVHAANGRTGRALGSLTLRVAIPLVGAFGGAKLDSPRCGAPAPGARDACASDTFPSRGFATGIVLGAVAAMALDTWLLAKPVHKPTRGWTPNASALRGGISVGVSGAF